MTCRLVVTVQLTIACTLLITGVSANTALAVAVRSPSGGPPMGRRFFVKGQGRAKSVANTPFLVGIFVAVGKIMQVHVCRLHDHAQVDNLLACPQLALGVVEGLNADLIVVWHSFLV